MLTRRLWKNWRTFNDAIFSSQLKRPLSIVYGPADDPEGPMWDYPVLGYCESADRGRVRILISDTCPPEQVLDTLLHEMIHQYQHQMGLEMDHGPSFEAWRMPCLLITGLDV